MSWYLVLLVYAISGVSIFLTYVNARNAKRHREWTQERRREEAADLRQAAHAIKTVAEQLDDEATPHLLVLADTLAWHAYGIEILAGDHDQELNIG